MEIQSVTSRTFHNALRAYRCLPHITAKLCGEINTAALRRAALVRLATFLYDEGELEHDEVTLLTHQQQLNHHSSSNIISQQCADEEDDEHNNKKASRSITISSSPLNDPPVMLTSELLSWILASCGIEPITATTTEGQQHVCVALKPLLVHSSSTRCTYNTVLASHQQHLDPVTLLSSLYSTPGDGHKYRCDFGERSVLDGVVKVGGDTPDSQQQFYASHVEHVCLHLVAAVFGLDPTTTAFEPLAVQIRSLFSKVQPSVYRDYFGAASSTPLSSLRMPLFNLALNHVATPPFDVVTGTDSKESIIISSSPQLVTLMGGYSAAEVNIRSIRIYRALMMMMSADATTTTTICPPHSPSKKDAVFEAAVCRIKKALALDDEKDDSTTITTLRVAVALALRGLDSLPTRTSNNTNQSSEEESDMTPSTTATTSYFGTLLVLEGDNGDEDDLADTKADLLEKEMRSLAESLQLLRPFPFLYPTCTNGDGDADSDFCFKVSNVVSYEDLTTFEKTRNQTELPATTTTVSFGDDSCGGSVVVSVSFSLTGYSDISYTINIPSHVVLSTFGSSSITNQAAIRTSEGSVDKVLETIRGMRLAAIGGLGSSNSATTTTTTSNTPSKAGVVTTTPSSVTSSSDGGLVTQLITALGTSSTARSIKPTSSTVVDQYKLLRSSRLTTGEKRPRDGDDNGEEKNSCGTKEEDDVTLERCLGGGGVGGGKKVINHGSKVIDPLVGLLMNRLVSKRLPQNQQHQASISPASTTTQEQQQVSHRVAESLVAKGVNSFTNLLHNGLPKPPVVPQPQAVSHVVKPSTVGAGILAPPPSTTPTTSASGSPFYSNQQHSKCNVVGGGLSTSLQPTPSLSIRVGKAAANPQHPTTTTTTTRATAPVPNSGNKSVFASPPPAAAAAVPQQQNNNTKRGGRGGGGRDVTTGGGRGGRGGQPSTSNNNNNNANNHAPQQPKRGGGGGRGGGGRGGRRGRG